MLKYSASGLFEANDFKNIGIKSNYLLLFFALANEEDNIRRQAALDLSKLIRSGEIQKGNSGGILCVPSWHSYSPFSPMMAAFLAVLFGADSLCIKDFCSLNAISEAQEASEIFGIPVHFSATFTAHVKGTSLSGLRFNTKEQDTLLLAACELDMKRKDSFSKDVVEPIRANIVTRVAAESWVLRSHLPVSPVVPDFWSETYEQAMIKSSHYNGENIYFSTVDQRYLFYSLACKILEGDFIAENICDVCDIITYDQALNFEDEEMPFRKLRLAKLLRDELYEELRYSSFDDEDLNSDTMPLMLMGKMLSANAKYIVYPSSGRESVARAKDMFEYLRSAGVTHVVFPEETSIVTKLKKAAVDAGLDIIEENINYYLSEYLD